MSDLTSQGIAALKSGDRVAARRLLAAALQQNPNDTQAWLWLSGLVEKDQERVDCLRQVLRIDPNHPAAGRGLAQLLKQNAPAAQTAGAVPVVSEPPPNRGSSLPDQKADPALVTPAQLPHGSPQFSEPVQSPPTAGNSLTARAGTAEAHGSQLFSETIPPAISASGGLSYVSNPVYGLENIRPVFQIRPSLIPALIAFWVFFFGAVIAGNLLSQADLQIGPLFALVIGSALELVVIYVIFRNLRVRYKLTYEYLSLPYQKHRIRIPVQHILNAECFQTPVQRLLGLGDIAIEANVKGELLRLRMRSIAQCDVRTQQILYLSR